MCCKKYFYDKFIEIINQWKEDEIAAISILVYSNETYVYKGIKNFFEISIGYIQKDDKYDSDDVKGLKVILNAEEDDETAEIILEFLVSNGVKNIGSEDFEKSYDENMNYIGKGPNGYYEVLNMISEVARDLQLHGIVNKKFGNGSFNVSQKKTAGYNYGGMKNKGRIRLTSTAQYGLTIFWGL